MSAREHMHATQEGKAMTRDRSSQAFRLFALIFAVGAALAIVLGAMISGAQAAPGWKLTQHTIPTADSAPQHITAGSDGNLWFTESNPKFDEQTFTEIGQVGQITPSGAVTEFAVCEYCSPNDIVQGPGGVLYFTTNDSGLGRITTSGEVLQDVAPANSTANGNGMAAHGDDIWYADFNNDSLWRYDTSGEDVGFTQYPVPNNPSDVAVDANGIVWYTANQPNAIGKLDPADGSITETSVPARPTQITIAEDGKVWYTERFNHHIGRLDPANSQVTRFPTLTPDAGPQDIAAAPDGNLWFTQANLGNVAQITPDGVITEESKAGKDDPNSGLENALGIAIGPDDQSVWFTMQADNKIAELTPPKK